MSSQANKWESERVHKFASKQYSHKLVSEQFSQQSSQLANQCGGYRASEKEIE